MTFFFLQNRLLSSTYLIRNSTAQLVHSWSGFGNLLCSTNHIRGVFEWSFPPGGEKHSSFIHSYGSVCSLMWLAIGYVWAWMIHVKMSTHSTDKNGWSHWQGWWKNRLLFYSLTLTGTQRSVNRAFWARRDKFASNWLISLRRNIPLQHVSIH